MSVLTLSGSPVNWANPPAPTDLVQWDQKTMYGGQVKGSLRTIAHLDQMDKRARKRFGVGIVVIQAPYNTTVAASAGTHDFDACLDLYIPGVSWWTQQRFLRAQGFGCWYRHPPLFGNHIHGFTLPLRRTFATKVGIWVPGQLVDYYNEAFGLSGMHTPGSDKSWFPDDKDATVFNLHAYIRKQQEDVMNAEQDKRLKRIEAMLIKQGKTNTERFQLFRSKINQALSEIDSLAGEEQVTKVDAKVSSVKATLREVVAALDEVDSDEVESTA